jgi:hypothetical protein
MLQCLVLRDKGQVDTPITRTRTHYFVGYVTDEEDNDEIEIDEDESAPKLAPRKRAPKKIKEAGEGEASGSKGKKRKADEGVGGEEAEEEVPKKKRGRPKKVREPQEEKPKKPRGRPRKNADDKKGKGKAVETEQVSALVF